MLSKHSRAELYNKLFTRRMEILEKSKGLKDQWQEGNYAEKEMASRAQMDNMYRSINALDSQARSELNHIDHALDRMIIGNYGICDSCGQEISEARLQAVPWARYCRVCVNKAEEKTGPDTQEWEESPLPGTGSWESVSAEEFEEMSDEEILELVHERIHADAHIETHNLEISSIEGIVYLNGSIPNELQHNLLMGVLQDILPLENIRDNLHIESLTGLGWHTGEELLYRPDQMEEELFFNRDE
ncbi:transcriptional regulator, TraR/DksA family [Desulfonatronospira thiodismutans ASO3-1]|uniref:Transcriptional regulator, TraR/DksA family n=1 Tax=Desulfonatronospira thiodismutans ASO3-1 TaxID=555779 RepID=D6SP09_9BACT|nr:TraR/DksA C4-type zinc finger protein [Desulfonatronospira thiodismutans]EFI34485.1 transcriptional regulator, TraR/DksA family [Desulfonatronospira thiodismutans ASO3-1]